MIDSLKQNYRVRSRLEVFYTGGAIRLSSDGATLACACADEVKLVAVETGAVVKTFAGDGEPVTALALSPEAKTLFVASRSLQLRCFDVDTGQYLRSFKGHRAPVADMVVDASGALLATASADRSARVWDVDGGYCTHHFTGHSGIVLCCVFHSSELLLITGGEDSQVRIWDLVAKSCVAVLLGHFSAVTSLSIAPDGWSLLTGGRDGVVICWNIRNHSKIATIPVYEAVEGVVAVPPTLCGIKQSKDSADTKAPLCFATGGEKGIVKLWRVDNGKCISDATPVGLGRPSAAWAIAELHSLPQGRGLLAATQDSRVLFLVSNNAATSDLQLERQLIGNNDEVTDLRFIGDDDGRPTHVAVASNGEHIRLLDAASLSCTATLDGHTDIVLTLDAVRLRSGRSLVASGSKDSTVRVWTVPEGQCVGLGTGHVGSVNAVAFSRKNGGFLVSGGADKLLKVWNVATLELDPGPDAPSLALRATAAVAAHEKGINAVAVAPNDSVVASASQDKTIKVWRLPDLVLERTLAGHKKGVWAVAFSPVDKALATASGDKTVKVWSLADGTCLRTFEGHQASVLRVEFLSAGAQLLTAGGDGLVKLWSMRTSECVNTFDAHEDKVWALAVGRGGGLLASGGGDGSVALWEDSTAADVAEAAADAQAAVLADQDLNNAVHARDWKKASHLALQMGRPGRLLSVINAAFDGGQEKGETILHQVVKDLDSERLKQCLEYCREWNTNSRTCHAAQAMLRAVIRGKPPSVLMGIPGLSALLEALTAYTQRHYARVDRLLRSTYVVDFVLGSMNALLPTEAEDGGAEENITQIQAEKINESLEEGDRSTLASVDDHPLEENGTLENEEEEGPKTKKSTAKTKKRKLRSH